MTTNGFSALLLTLSAVKDLQRIEKVFTTAAGTCFAMVNSIKAAGLNVEFSDLDDMSAGINNEVFKKTTH